MDKKNVKENKGNLTTTGNVGLPDAGKENKEPMNLGNDAAKSKQDAPAATAAAAKEDSAVADKLAELEEAIKKSNELNARLEAKEKELDEQAKNAPQSKLSEAERANVAAAHASKAQRMKEHLMKQPKVKIFVPLEGSEKKGTLLPVTPNGYRVNVPKGVYVEVPEQIGQIVMDSLNQTQAATDIPQNLDNMDEEKRYKIFT